ncbi:type IV toxin-antitoxin system AbiEi family antitoxin domain-containing protein [Allorhizocola rhizosphaerae]|uniref:type IV toxin-antitoxin system AbiEi family antitoxin domain-containing protein n=1 Tax=Allorhizocola rhizosphaerae TaxID=1872709 RepID=UPI000E3BAF0D|nr:type IV toxin-antitoxin system AbiEi family antitoxin domain-containing protein [Allorhizocola rhizosphaerae]
MPRAATIRSLADIAEDQWGLFTRQQAESTGMAWTTLARAAKHGIAERVTHGVYRLRGTPADEHRATRAAWLQLAPDIMVWDRSIGQGVACRWTAAAIYGLGSNRLWSAGVHQFTLPVRRQTRRADVRLYRAVLSDRDCARVGGLLVTRPGRIISDLLHDGEDLAIVAQLVADALREAKTSAQDMAAAIASHAAWFGFAEHDGQSLLDWLLHQAPQRQPQRSWPSSMDSGKCEATSTGQHYLLVHTAESNLDDRKRTTIRLTTVMREGPPRRATRRQQPSRSS